MADLNAPKTLQDLERILERDIKVKVAGELALARLAASLFLTGFPQRCRRYVWKRGNDAIFGPYLLSYLIYIASS
jgi:hypothetical protein